MRFNPDATVWVAKQRILCTLNQSLKDVLNYGLFQPASNGRDGKFLDEEHLLREYPQPISRGVPALEVQVLVCPILNFLRTQNPWKRQYEDWIHSMRDFQKTLPFFKFHLVADGDITKWWKSNQLQISWRSASVPKMPQTESVNSLKTSCFEENTSTACQMPISHKAVYLGSLQHGTLWNRNLELICLSTLRCVSRISATVVK